MSVTGSVQHTDEGVKGAVIVLRQAGQHHKETAGLFPVHLQHLTLIITLALTLTLMTSNYTHLKFHTFYICVSLAYFFFIKLLSFFNTTSTNTS